VAGRAASDAGCYGLAAAVIKTTLLIRGGEPRKQDAAAASGVREPCAVPCWERGRCAKSYRFLGFTGDAWPTPNQRRSHVLLDPKIRGLHAAEGVPRAECPTTVMCIGSGDDRCICGGQTRGHCHIGHCTDNCSSAWPHGSMAACLNRVLNSSSITHANPRMWRGSARERRAWMAFPERHNAARLERPHAHGVAHVWHWQFREAS
jgi:hypothetical protein